MWRKSDGGANSCEGEHTIRNLLIFTSESGSARLQVGSNELTNEPVTSADSGTIEARECESLLINFQRFQFQKLQTTFPQVLQTSYHQESIGKRRSTSNSFPHVVDIAAFKICQNTILFFNCHYFSRHSWMICQQSHSLVLLTSDILGEVFPGWPPPDPVAGNRASFFYFLPHDFGRCVCAGCWCWHGNPRPTWGSTICVNWILTLWRRITGNSMTHGSIFIQSSK